MVPADDAAPLSLRSPRYRSELSRTITAQRIRWGAGDAAFFNRQREPSDLLSLGYNSKQEFR